MIDRDELEQAVQDAEVDLRLAARRLDEAELGKDRRLWTADESSEYRAATYAYDEAESALRRAREAARE